jgi:hypothetical protein
MRNVLALPCEFCGMAYGDHTLEGLALCVETGLNEIEPDEEAVELHAV